MMMVTIMIMNMKGMIMMMMIKMKAILKIEQMN